MYVTFLQLRTRTAVWRKSVCRPVFEEWGWNAFDKLMSEQLKLEKEHPSFVVCQYAFMWLCMYVCVCVCMCVHVLNPSITPPF